MEFNIMFHWWGCLILVTSVHNTVAVTNYGGIFVIDGTEGGYISEKIVKKPFGKTCTYTLFGRGVEDTLEEDCAANLDDYSVISSKNYHAIIYPNNRPLSLYTDTYGTLVIIKEGDCNLKIYKTNLLKLTPSVSKLGSSVCKKIKAKIAGELSKCQEYWRKWKINHDRQMKGLPPAEIIFDPLKNQVSTPSLYVGKAESSANKGPNKPYFTSAHFKSDSNGQCMITIVIEGRGVMESIKRPCSDIKDPQMVNFKEGIVIGNPDKDIFSLISDQWGVLVEVNNGQCTKKTFSEEAGNMSVTVFDLDDKDCAALKKKMVKERKSFKNFWRTRVASIKQTFKNLFPFKLW